MELDRQFIVRADFPSVRRGYDQEEVDRHLQEVAEAVEGLKRSHEARDSTQPGSGGSLAGVAADQVRVIVEAAERSAAAIEMSATEESDRVTGEATHTAEQERDKARGEAERVRAEAQTAATETRERAEAEAAEHLTRVEAATSDMRERADVVEADLGGLVDELRTTIESLVQSVRASAGSLESELESIHADLAEVRESTPSQDTTREPAFEADAGQTTKQAAVVRSDELTVAGTGEEDHRHPDEQPVDEELPYEEPDADAEDEEGIEDEVEDEVGDEVEDQDGDEVEDRDEPLLEDEGPAPASSGEGDPAEGARLIALNMALNGTPREETASYLGENFDLEDQEAILDEVYARVGG